MVIFLMDGYRWHELYEGADSSLIFTKRYNKKDSAWTVSKYWHSNLETRRRKLMPLPGTQSHVFLTATGTACSSISSEKIKNDEFGHAGDYGDYLDAAHYADAMFRDIWATLQADPFYKDKTDLLIFPDHGRGIDAGWTSHGARTAHADETYFLAMGPGVPAKGEVKGAAQVYQAQYAQTIATLLGLHFTASHPIAEPVKP